MWLGVKSWQDVPYCQMECARKGLEHVLTIYTTSHSSLPVEPKCRNDHLSITVLGAIIEDVLKKLQFK